MSTKASRVPEGIIQQLLVLTTLVAAAGCGAGFDSPDSVQTLRVLGVRKDQPYAPPTVDPANPSLVKLTMLAYDGTRSYSDTPRPIQRLWFSGCDDLPGDQYFTCLARMYGLWQLYTQYITVHPDKTLQEGSSWSPADPPDFLTDDQVFAIVQLVNPRIPQALARDYLGTYRIGAGSYFTYPIPLGIIANHQPSSDPNIPAYGLSFIFFTLCAGTIDVAPGWQGLNIGDILHNATLGFPFVCLDDNKNTLGPNDFVSGYTQVFVPSDGTVNHNPVIDGVLFNGNNVPADAGPSADAGTDTDAGAGAGVGAYCIDEVCVPPPAAVPCPNLPLNLHVPACSGKCPAYEFSPSMTAAGNNDIGQFVTDKRSPKGEQMWVDYYTDRGTLNHAVKLLRDGSVGWSADGSAGWSADFSDQWTPPVDPGPVNLWAVAHDTRGGTAWVRLLICVD